MKNNAPRATAYEQQRINRMKAEIGCICCLLRTGVTNYYVEVHHIVQGNKRLGHWYTLPLCRTHHRIRGTGGIFTSIADGSKAFAKVHGTELDLWLKVQHMLELPDELPPTKVLARRLPHVDDLRAHTHHADPAGVLAGGERNALLSGHARLGLSQPGLGDPLEDAAAVFVGLPAGGPGDAS